MPTEPVPRLLIDTDIGADDAVALVLAARHADAWIELVTTVAGNTSVENATRNALYVLERCGLCDNAPVSQGAAEPLVREPVAPRRVHGRDGLGDLGLPPPSRSPTPEPAAESLVRHALDAPGVCTLVALGPLTNVALALRAEPAFARAIRSCIVSGGMLDPAAPPDFNLRADAEAAQEVLRSGMPITLVPLELSRGDARVSPRHYARMPGSADPIVRFVGLMCRFLGEQGIWRFGWAGAAAVPDAVAMAVALEPGLVTGYADGKIDVITATGAAYGRLLVEPGPAGSVRIVTGIDAVRSHALLRQVLRFSG